MNAVKRQSGAVLLESVVSLVILGFVTLALMTLMGYAARGYVMVRDNTDTSGKVQVAVDRIRLELENMQLVTTLAVSSMTFTDRMNQSQTLALDANDNSRLLLGGNLLLDNVAGFTLIRNCGNQDGYSGGNSDLASVTVTITMGGNIPAYTLIVYPRSIMNCP